MHVGQYELLLSAEQLIAATTTCIYLGYFAEFDPMRHSICFVYMPWSTRSVFEHLETIPGYTYIYSTPLIVDSTNNILAVRIPPPPFFFSPFPWVTMGELELDPN